MGGQTVANLNSDPAQLPLVGNEGGPLVPATDDAVAQAMERGELALERRELAAAMVAFREALEVRPTYSKARLRLATALDRAGDTAAALSELDRALADEKDNVSLLVGRAALLSAKLR